MASESRREESADEVMIKNSPSPKHLIHKVRNYAIREEELPRQKVTPPKSRGSRSRSSQRKEKVRDYRIKTADGPKPLRHTRIEGAELII